MQSYQICLLLFRLESVFFLLKFLTEYVFFILDYSMVTSISPLETLHNSLTLEQMDRFLDKMIESDQLGGSAGPSDKE